MQTDVFTNITKIIERDSKATTYKFALLRGVIDIIQDNSPYISLVGDRAHFPIGLLMEKWLLYYYPVLESPVLLPQINGSARLAFEGQFKKIIAAYQVQNGFSVFYNDLRNKGIPAFLYNDFMDLCNKLYKTITLMPMKYTGRSISNDFYSVFNYSRPVGRKRIQQLDIEYLIHNYGTFSFPADYYEAFRILGSFINGQDSILFKWAEFSVNASGQTLSVEKVVNEVLRNPITEREVRASKNLYADMLRQQDNVYCVWTGKKLSGYDIDHMIPFSVWKNNDLWNLLPSAKDINNKKRDKIPSPILIGERQELIIHYWQLLNEKLMHRFKKEIQLALLGNEPFETWPQSAIAKLQGSCEYLISKRGYEEWRI
jgi:hypothetical protein